MKPTEQILPETTYLDCPTFQMVSLPGGRFLMGEKRRASQPIHEVTVSPFEMGKYPVTEEVWQMVMAGTALANPARFKGRQHPVESVSWKDVQIFLDRLNALPEVEEKNLVDSKHFRLPSEAQWEYAARAGSQDFPYAGGYRLEEVGWFNENSRRGNSDSRFGTDGTMPVGLKLSNDFGLYDMSGNVWEWCADHWHDSYDGAPDDGRAWTEGGDAERRVVRGGSWYFNDYYCRVSFRLSYSPSDIRLNSLGFRVARY